MLKKISLITLIVIAGATAFLGFQTKNLEFDYDFEKFFPQNSPETDFYLQHRKKFQTDNDFAVVAIGNNGNSIFDSIFLQRTVELTHELESYKLIRSVTTIINAEEQVKAPFSSQYFKRKFINISDPENYPADSALIMQRPEFVSSLIDKESKYLVLFIQHKQYMSKEGCDELVKFVNQKLEEHNFKESYKAGRCFGQVYYVDIMKTELTFFVAISMVLVVFFLWLAFRSSWGLWLPLTVVTVSLVWTTGFIALIGEPLNLIMTVLPTIMFVVAMSDVIHLVSKYLDELRQGKEKIEALKTAYREIGWATFLTSLTTATGFLSLLMVKVEPIQVFGKYTAFGVLLAFIIAYTLLPAMIYFSKAPKVAQKPLYNVMWNKILHKGFIFTLKQRYKILISFSALSVIAVFGFLKLETNNFLLDDLKTNDPVKQEFLFFQKHFSGVRPFELAIQVKGKDRTAFEPEVIRQIDKLDAYLVNEYGLKHVNSIASVVKSINRSNHMGNQDFYLVPEDETELKKIIKQIENFGVKTGRMTMIVDSSLTYLRSSSTIGDFGNVEISKRNEKLKAKLDSLIDSSLLDVTITGTAELLDTNMKYLSVSLVEGLLLALIIVALIMGILFQSLKIILIAVIPNVLPLFFVVAIMGYFGIPLKMTTAIIFTIAFGIAVDDTIHFMTKYKLELKKGRSQLYALKRTYIGTGKAIIVTSLIISGGFLMLIFSSFLGTFYIGLLISLTLVFAVIADLLLIPVFLLMFCSVK